jgi:hypothetical protein
MVCPNCGATVTFPQMLSLGKTTSSLRLHHDEPAPAPAKSFMDHFGFLAPLRRFEHWNMVLVCVVPFLVLGGLLVGAAVVRQRFGNAPAAPAAPPVQVDKNAWRKMTDLARADLLVQEKLADARRAGAALGEAQGQRDRLHALHHGKQAPDAAVYAAITAQYAAADKAVRTAQAGYDCARRSFDAAYQKYCDLGGTIDYRSQMPR